MPSYPYFGYQPYYTPPVPDQLAQLRGAQYQPMQQPQQFQPQQNPPAPSIVWIQSEQEALNYLVAPNSAVTLWDSNSPVVYLKQADASGKPSTKIYDLVERNSRPVQAPSSPAVEYAPLSRLEALEAKLNALEAVREQPAKSAAKKTAQKEDTE